MEMGIMTWSRSNPSIFGTGALQHLGQRAKMLGISKAFLVTEQALIDFKVATQVIDKLTEAGIEIVTYTNITGEPTTNNVAEAIEIVRNDPTIDGIIGCGGGSAMDCAKGVALLSKNPGKIQDYIGVPFDFVPKRGLPLISIPTTSGTGSEASPFVVLTDSETGLKNCAIYTGDLAIVDPTLTYTVPASVTCTTGLDALAHVVEGMTSVYDFNYVIQLMCVDAVKIIFKWLPIAVAEPENKEAREMMALASHMAGMIIMEYPSHFGHSFGEAFGAKFHTPHGITCAWGLPGSVAIGAKYQFEKSLAAAESMDIVVPEGCTPDELATLMTNKVLDLMKECKCKSLKASGYSLEDCLSIAEDCTKNGGYPGIPTGTPGEKMSVEELEKYITLCYEAYQ